VLGGRSVCVETLLGRSELERFVRAPALDSQLFTVFLPNVFGLCKVELYACTAKQYHGGMQHIPGRGGCVTCHFVPELRIYSMNLQ
jgi:hypothetical protein